MESVHWNHLAAHNRNRQLHRHAHAAKLCKGPHTIISPTWAFPTSLEVEQQTWGLGESLLRANMMKTVFGKTSQSEAAIRLIVGPFLPPVAWDTDKELLYALLPFEFFNGILQADLFSDSCIMHDRDKPLREASRPRLLGCRHCHKIAQHPIVLALISQSVLNWAFGWGRFNMVRSITVARM